MIQRLYHTTLSEKSKSKNRYDWTNNPHDSRKMTIFYNFSGWDFCVVVKYFINNYIQQEEICWLLIFNVQSKEPNTRTRKISENHVLKQQYVQYKNDYASDEFIFRRTLILIFCDIHFEWLHIFLFIVSLILCFIFISFLLNYVLFSVLCS